jgi:hypothetical protein
MDANELDLVPVADLKAALLRRHDHVVLISTDERLDEVSFAWQGDPYKVIGLLEEVKHRLFAHREAERS